MPAFQVPQIQQTGQTGIRDVQGSFEFRFCGQITRMPSGAYLFQFSSGRRIEFGYDRFDESRISKDEVHDGLLDGQHVVVPHVLDALQEDVSPVLQLVGNQA